MKWTAEASEAIAKVPFFVRGRVKKRVEEEARRCGDQDVRLEHVRTCQQRFLHKMEEEVKGYRVETCFGPTGCPNRAVAYDRVAEKVEERLARRDLKTFLKNRVEGALKLHHEFQVTISDCPNACSRPQIADVGLIGACRPRVSGEACSQCGACVETCREEAISLSEDGPALDFSRCLSCGQCIKVCPTGTLEESEKGFRILVGGKLGRHPRLGRELAGIHNLEETLQILDHCLDHYQKNCNRGERFGEVLEKTRIEDLEVKDR